MNLLATMCGTRVCITINNFGNKGDELMFLYVLTPLKFSKFPTGFGKLEHKLCSFGFFEKMYQLEGTKHTLATVAFYGVSQYPTSRH